MKESCPFGTLVHLVTAVDENHAENAPAEVMGQPFWMLNMHPGKALLTFGPEDELWVDDDSYEPGHIE